MNLNTARTAIRQFLNKTIRIDEWDADVPASLYAPGSTPAAPLAAATAIEYPALSLELQRVGEAQLVGVARLPYTISHRWSSQYRLADLPLLQLEALAESLQGHALMSLPNAGGIKSVAFNGEDLPLTFARDGTEQGDWITTIRIEFVIQFFITSIEIPAGFGGPTIPEQTWDDEVGIRIYRALHPVRSEDSTSVLDATYTIEQ